MSTIADYAPFFLRAAYYKRSRNKTRMRREWQNRVAIALIAVGILSGIATYAAFTEIPPFGNDPDTLIWLLNLDLIILIGLVSLVAYKIVGLWSGRKRGLAGSHLQVRLVYTFSLLAALPVIIMTVFSAVFFHYGVQTWFSQRVQTAVNESQAVAQSYLQEHKQVIRADTLAMASDLNRQASLLVMNDQALERIMRTQSILRNLSEAIIFDSSGRVISRSGITFSLELEQVPRFAIEQAEAGEVVLMTGAQDDRVRALVKLSNFIDSYLYVGRKIDPQVLAHLDATQKAVQDYQDLQARYAGMQVTVTLMFFVVGILLLLAAIWFGLLLARQLVSPIGELINVSDRVRGGDLSARVDIKQAIEEFDYLGQSFNRMTKRIQEQQNELIDANRQLDRRRRFTETILTGVTSGVIGIDKEGKITMANEAAADFLGAQVSEITNSKIVDVMPQIEELLATAHERPNKITQSEVPVSFSEKSRRIFLVRIAIELVGDQDVGAIITFDDITDLQSAQKKAAWADVARRIAHEIKNPLTPIQLSAERLKRKYIKEIESDPETFIQCTDTIIKHVNDIGHMVNEFSSFARMPEPVMKPEKLNRHIQDMLVLQKQAHTDIQFNVFGLEEKEYMVRCDAQQLRQAMTNLVQNAIDSIESKNMQHAGNGSGSDYVDVLVFENTEAEELVVAVSDSGVGFPADHVVETLADPYVTHKEKGTGLGLAIVKKIMEDHKGRLILGAPTWLRSEKGWRDLGGASVCLVLPISKPDIDQQADAA